MLQEREIIIELPEFCKGCLHFSKQGWVLISLLHNTRPCGWTPDQLILLNPLNKAIIELPEYEMDPSGKDEQSILRAYFSIEEGRPHYVLLYIRGLDCPLKLSGAKAGDAVWTDYCHNRWQDGRGNSGFHL